jgi:hypothetical protein
MQTEGELPPPFLADIPEEEAEKTDPDKQLGSLLLKLVFALFIIAILMLLSMIAQQYREHLSLEQTVCTIEKANVNSDTCKTQKCTGGKKTNRKCQTVSYTCYNITLDVTYEFRDQVRNVSISIPETYKTKNEVRHVIRTTYAKGDVLACYVDRRNVERVVLEQPSIAKTVLTLVLYILISLVGMILIRWVQKRQRDYHLKLGPTKSKQKRDAKKPHVGKAKVKRH